MRYSIYKRGLQIIFIAFLPVLALYDSQEYILRVTSFQFIVTANYYLIRIMALFLLLFSACAMLSGVKEARMLEKPVIFTVMGFMLVILLIGPPIAGYFSVSDTETIKQLDEKELTQAIKEAVNLENSAGDRYLLAVNYFVITGKAISYLNVEGKEVVFVPSDSVVKSHDEFIKIRNKVTSNKSEIRIKAITLIIILILSGLGFIIWYRRILKR